MIARDEPGEVVVQSVMQFEFGSGWHPIAVSADSSVISGFTLSLAIEGRLDDPHNVLVADELSFQRNEAPTVDFEFDPVILEVDEPVFFDDSGRERPGPSTGRTTPTSGSS